MFRLSSTRVLRRLAHTISAFGLALVGPLACGGGNSTSPSVAVPCDQVNWGFTGPESVRSGQTVALTLVSIYLPPGGGHISGSCDQHASNLVWTSSAPNVASVKAASGLAATVTGGALGTVNITVSFMYDGVTPKSTYTQMKVIGS